MEQNQYLSMFIDESNDHLQALNENLLILEKNPQDIDIVQNIFRSAHTLKGMSASMGFDDLASLTHEMENVLDLVRNRKLQMNNFIFDGLFRSLDALEGMVQDIIQGGTGKLDVSEIVSNLKAILTGAPPSVPAAATKQLEKSSEAGLDLDEFQSSILQQSIESGSMVFYVKVTVHENCVLKAARAYMVFDLLERHGEVVQSSPSVQDIEQEKFDQSFSVYYISRLDQTSLEQQISNISEISSVQIVPVGTEMLRQLSKDKNKRISGQPQHAERSSASDLSAAAGSKEAPDKSSAQAKQPQMPRTIRVDIDRLDTLMNLFSELLIDRVRLESLAEGMKNQELTETVEHIARVSLDLQNIVLNLRMVPVDTVFNRFPRMVRDLARTLEKKVELVVSGAETELDRTVIDEIGDPLVHLLRNSLDHGIETVADRIAANKPETGKVHLRAYHSGNYVFIEIEDDGRGINREKVIQTALKNGLITKDAAGKMTDLEIYQLLFASGFSTADKISDISGRGVGLDVVKSKIASLSGHVAVDSVPGKGTKFTVQLPLTLSIISAMLVKAGGERYAIPLSSIVETSILKKDHIRTIHGDPMIDFRDTVIPVVSLAELFDCREGQEPDREELEAVVIRKGEKMVALLVDEFIGQQEIVLKSLGKYLKNLFAISGATILGDGQVSLIIDPNAIIK
ncbi:chemotaxis protein CheA [Ferviditalea candida]|uniref:Chemotaxis protein CheA n=1 Tax=Ferviditalea candida TaxID=3108399 RepID=A0ABU5ZF54_9BACL|nr:chemotaxis protein CheA [Paenibacillaceae bacterium T2]